MKVDYTEYEKVIDYMRADSELSAQLAKFMFCCHEYSKTRDKVTLIIKGLENLQLVYDLTTRSHIDFSLIKLMEDMSGSYFGHNLDESYILYCKQNDKDRAAYDKQTSEFSPAYFTRLANKAAKSL